MLHKTCKKLSRAINSLISEKHLIKWREACKLCEAIATIQYLCVRICICVYVCKWCLLILETPKSSVSSRKTWTSVGFSRLTWPKLDIFQWKVMIFKNLFRAGSMLNVRDVYKRQNYSLTHWLIRRPSKHKKKKKTSHGKTPFLHIDVDVSFMHVTCKSVNPKTWKKLRAHRQTHRYVKDPTLRSLALGQERNHHIVD